MKYFSTNRQTEDVSFEQAVRKGLAPDNGLYFPENIVSLPASFFENIENLSKEEIAYAVAEKFVDGEIPEEQLKQIVKETLDFDIPVVEVEKDVYSLELFHGPTLAFKDVGARFMARCLRYFLGQKGGEVTILVATSGDTGSAVANGFLGVEGINVVILYPQGKVSKLQEQQLTTLGQNIRAYEVKGTFDDCQHLVKTAFLDETLTKELGLTSANSINIARLIPQSFYYFLAYQQLKDKNKKVVVSVPSGNFGNISGGIIATQMGLPIDRFVASTNVNDIVPDYLEKGVYTPKASTQTIANAMDVGNPSNFVRMKELYEHAVENFRGQLSGYSYSDEEIRVCMKEVYDQTGYVLDPHGAVGYLGLKAYQKENPDTQGIFLETAHPAKFLDVVEEVLGQKVEIPARLAAYLGKEKSAVVLDVDFEQLKAQLRKDLSK